MGVEINPLIYLGKKQGGVEIYIKLNSTVDVNGNLRYNDNIRVRKKEI